MVPYNYDLFIIGTGDAGTSVAQLCAAAGLKVGIVDELQFGGTCPLRGCNPKRALAGVVELLYRVNQMQSRGINGVVSIVWNELIEYKEELVHGIPEMKEQLLKSKGIDTFHGFASFTGRHECLIDGTKIQFNKAVIATGAKPRILGIPGEQHIVTSEKILSMRKLPPRIVFIGGGYISMEFARVIAAAGVEVTILEMTDNPLAGFDRELVSMLIAEMQNKGISIYTNVKVLGIEKTEKQLLVITEGKENFLFKADLVVHGAGRVPDVERLQLEKADIEADASRIKVNEYLQCISNESIYVAGDAHSQGIQLTPVAEIEGIITANNLLHGNTMIPDYSVIPSVAFTFPEIGAVGIRLVNSNTENDYDVIFENTSAKKITQRLGLNASAFKIIIEKSTGKIKGAHMLGYNIDEVINYFALIIKSGFTLDEVKSSIWSYPSVIYDTISRL